MSVAVALWFPHASVASHLRVIVVAHPVTVVTSLKRFTVTPLHASEAVGTVNDGVTLQLIVELAPALPIVGGVLSIRIML